MKKRMDTLVECPYYKFEERQKIFCEGVQDGTMIHLAFDKDISVKNYKKTYCRKCWQGCRIAKMLNDKWGYEP